MCCLGVQRQEVIYFFSEAKLGSWGGGLGVHNLMLLTEDGELRLFTFPLPDHVGCHAHVYPRIGLLRV